MWINLHGFIRWILSEKKNCGLKIRTGPRKPRIESLNWISIPPSRWNRSGSIQQWTSPEDQLEPSYHSGSWRCGGSTSTCWTSGRRSWDGGGWGCWWWRWYKRVFLVEGFYLVSHGLGIYILNLLIGFLSSQVDPEILDNEGPTLPSSVNDEFRPLRLPPPQVQVLVPYLLPFLVF